jgi:hypothetical protein
MSESMYSYKINMLKYFGGGTTPVPLSIPIRVYRPGRVPTLKHTYECAHNSYLTPYLDIETLARTLYGKCRRSHEIQRIKNSLNYSATLSLTTFLDGNMSKYYNVFELVEQ